MRLITFSANSLKPSRTTPKAQEQESKRFSMVKIGFRKDQRHRLITDRISTTDFPLQQSDFIARREEGTSQWFLESSILTTWLQKLKSSLFCPGIPGAGKTILAAIMIDHISKKELSDSVGLAYIYCNYKTQADVNMSSLLAAIVKQLV